MAEEPYIPQLQTPANIGALDNANLSVQRYDSAETGSAQLKRFSFVSVIAKVLAAIPNASGSVAGLMAAADFTKLAGIASGATANSADATLLARSNHTGSQSASTISDFAEAVDDRVNALLVAGANVTLTYDDGANTLTVASSGGGGGGGPTVNRATFSNANYSWGAGVTIASQIGTLSAARTVTLPAASSLTAGTRLSVVDDSGTCSYWHTLSITPAGADTINGVAEAYVLALPYESIELVSNGSNGWIASRIPSARNKYLVIEDDFLCPEVPNYQLFGAHNYYSYLVDAYCNSVSDTTAIGAVEVAFSSATAEFNIASNRIPLSGTLIRSEYRLKLTTLATGTEDYVLSFGLQSRGATNTIEFQYNRSANTNWVARVHNGTSATTQDTGVAVATTAYRNFGIELNAAGTQVRFWIDGGLVATITTNIPTGHLSASSITATKTAGTSTNLAAFRFDRVRTIVSHTIAR